MEKEKAFVVYNHKVARYLAQNDYYWSDVRKDKFDQSKIVFIYETNTEKIRQLVSLYINQEQKQGNKNYGLHRNL